MTFELLWFLSNFENCIPQLNIRQPYIMKLNSASLDPCDGSRAHFPKMSLL